MPTLDALADALANDDSVASEPVAQEEGLAIARADALAPAPVDEDAKGDGEFGSAAARDGDIDGVGVLVIDTEAASL